jgi:riboflavin synthase
MFTGIIEEVGVIREILTNLDGLEIEIDASLVLSDLKVNDSISCSGI